MANCKCCGRKLRFNESMYSLNKICISGCCNACSKKWDAVLPKWEAEINDSMTAAELYDLAEKNGFDIAIDSFKPTMSEGMLGYCQGLLKEKQKEQKRIEIENQTKWTQAEKNNMMITNGYNFEGYIIKNIWVFIRENVFWEQVCLVKQI